MANKTFREAYDDDQAGLKYGDSLDALGADDFVGVTHDPVGDHNPADMVDIGITFAQLKDAINSPAYIVSGSAPNFDPGTGVIQVMHEVPRPVEGFGIGSQFQIEMVIQRTGTQGPGWVGLRVKEAGTNTGDYIIWIQVNSGTSDGSTAIPDGPATLTRRTTVGIIAATPNTVFQFPEKSIESPYGLTPTIASNMAIIGYDSTVQPITWEFVCLNDTAGTEWVLSSYSIFGIRG